MNIHVLQLHHSINSWNQTISSQMPPIYCADKKADRTAAENKVCEEFDDKVYYKDEYIPKSIYSDFKFIEDLKGKARARTHWRYAILCTFNSNAIRHSRWMIDDLSLARFFYVFILRLLPPHGETPFISYALCGVSNIIQHYASANQNTWLLTTFWCFRCKLTGLRVCHVLKPVKTLF